MVPREEGSRKTSIANTPPPRVMIEDVEPEIDAGRFPIKRVVGEGVRVRARIFTDGHDRIAACLHFREAAAEAWREVPMRGLGNDRFEAEVQVSRLGRAAYTVEAWIDAFGSWREGLAKKVAAGLDVASELLEGAELVRAAAARARGAEAELLAERAQRLAGRGRVAERAQEALAEDLAALMALHPDRGAAARYGRELEVQVECERARSGAWYEFFPRSCSPEPGRHGTLRDAEERLAYAASMGFDVVYLPPVHPIGRSFRKGPNNTPAAAPGDPGSPWAIGAEEGGHTAVHPELGTLEDFDRFVARARQLGVEVAIDIAFQCSPDHPFVRKHPAWFRHRPDGTIQYAENPPKVYQDVFPLDFACEDWRALWEELRDVVLFWIGHGVTIFRVDNPHTKPLPFWEWLIREVREAHPEVVFLSEAFTRPAVMQYLAKAGFSQSYSYFTWRNTKRELTDYLTELGEAPQRDFLRPNLFANTPDILHEFLQVGGRPAFQIRATLAATLSGSWGVYGPPYELCEAAALAGTEEYLDSEKYQLRAWDVERPGNIRDYLARLNEIRREHPALTRGGAPRFHPISDESLIAYSRAEPGEGDAVLVVVNLDPHHAHAGWVELPLRELGLDAARPYQMDDLLGGARFLWHGSRNFVSLDPASVPAHVFCVRRLVHSERDFDYFA
jgi:starch synthase (maltosyl-transferring)